MGYMIMGVVVVREEGKEENGEADRAGREALPLLALCFLLLLFKALLLIFLT
jgi:hypothetical protein